MNGGNLLRGLMSNTRLGGEPYALKGARTVRGELSGMIVVLLHRRLASPPFLQFELGGIGRFQITGNNTLRYIIGDVEGI